uniref:C-C motif chemokine n=1 Tax=Sander lucioperca TaxID=283035 RepID=A0A8D0CP30_SANLU
TAEEKLRDDGKACCVGLHYAGAAGPFCCTQYQENPIPVKFLKYYRIQEVIDHCNIKAIIFKTWRNKLVCADPDRKWVKIAQDSELKRKNQNRHQY